MNLTIIPPSWTPMLTAALRIMTGLLFLEHGSGKLLHFPALPNVDQIPAMILYATGFLELIGGALITIGLFTRPVAFLLAGNMAVAYFMAHFPRSFFPAVNQGDAAILFCFVFLFFAAAGAGRWSVDNAVSAA